MFHPDEDRTEIFEVYDQPAEDLAAQQIGSLIHRHAKIVCEEGFPQARFRELTQQGQTVWADDPHTREIEIYAEASS
jgi:hypothetical protein